MQKSTLDLSFKNIPPLFYAMQGDTDRKVQVALFDGGVLYDASSDAVSVWYSGPGGDGNFSEGISIEKNVLTITLNGNITAVPGNYALAVMLSRSNGKVSTWNMILKVGVVPGYGSPAAQDYFEAFQAGELAQRIESVNARITSEVATLNGSIANESASLANRIEAVDSRISGIIADGQQTEGNTELLDIRTGYDGAPYKTAGDSVRGQVQQLDNKKSNSFYNMITPEVFSAGKNSFCTSEVQEDGMVLVTSNTVYGRYDATLKFSKDLEVGKTFLFAAKVFVKNTPEAPFHINPIIYAYAADGTNLKEFAPVQSTVLNVSESGEYELTSYYRVSKDNIRKLDIGVVIDKLGAQIGVYAYNFFETLYDDYQLYEDLNLFDFMNDKGYVLRIDNLVSILAKKALTAKTAQTADSSKNSLTADFAQYAKTEDYYPIDSFNLSDSTGFKATISGVSGNKVSFSITEDYGGIIVPCNLQPSSNLLFIFKHIPLTGITYLSCGVVDDSSGRWAKQEIMSELQYNGESYAWCVINLPESGFRSTEIRFTYASGMDFIGKDLYFDFIAFTQLGKDTVIDESKVLSIISSSGVYYKIHESILDLYGKTISLSGDIADLHEKTETLNKSYWNGRNVLFIGDSLTAAKKYPNTIKELLGINVFYHCKGGVGLTAMVDGDKGLGGDYDNETDASGVLKPLSSEDVTGKDLIVLYGGYNNRGTAEGSVGDCYNPDGSGQKTIAGYMQYCIKRIYEELSKANNLTCRLLIVTVDCAGRYNYIDADGYQEWPAGSGLTMETMANIQKAVAEHNSLLCLDLWHNSGINRNTWTVFGASSEPENPQYSPYRLNSQGEPENEDRIRYSKGQSYYQVRNGVVILEEYTGSAPYPYNNDQLHKSEAGYKRIGECIAGIIAKGYGY